MKFSERWLRSLVPVSLDSAQLAHVLTMAGLEVEAVDPAAAAFSGVVVGHVLQVDAHPRSERLHVCRVDAGGEALQIVCGAPNVAAGMRVPCARPGAQLPGGVAISAVELRGVRSEGMLCSAAELGLSEEAGGLMALPEASVPGTDVRALLELDDQVFTLKLTPNRGDCLSLGGIARELAALTGVELPALPLPRVEETHAERLPVRSLDHSACPSYRGRILHGVDLARRTPDWMVRRLERSGVRSINAVVDATNYVMLELGQPLHAFDLQRLRGGIAVRFARPGEQLTLLNGQSVDLAADMLVITDEGGPVALAGLMGGEHSGVSDGTTSLFLESACFSPAAVAGRMRRLGFSSDAGHRFERGVDPALGARALDRLTELIQQIAGGSAGPVTEDCAPPAVAMPIRLDLDRARRLLGIDVDAAQAAAMFRRLGFGVVAEDGALLASAPSWRFDMEREEDLVEEIARLYGYERIPETLPRAPGGMVPAPEARRERRRLLEAVADRDYQEVINYSFIDARWERDLHGNVQAVELANPIAAQMAVMRSSLVAGLLDCLRANLNRQRERVRVFELGCCFQRAGDGYLQPERLAALAYGPVLPRQWGAPDRAVDFFDIKGDLEALLPPGVATFLPAQHAALHPGRSASVCIDGRTVGMIGELHPRWQQELDLPAAPVLFELDVDALQARPQPRHGELSRFPSVSQDLAVIVPEEVSWASLRACVEGCGIAQLTAVLPFDLYRGAHVGQGSKSLAFRVLLQDTQKTLTDAEVDGIRSLILLQLEKSFGARLRD